jgi:DNA-binding beta-propeller fold protein YncE
MQLPITCNAVVPESSTLKCARLIVGVALGLLSGYARAEDDRTVVETVAGTGAAEDNGAAGAARATNIGHPFGVEIGPDGALYITEVLHHRVRRLDLASGELTTVAGCGRKGYAGDGGPAVEAEMNEPYEVRFDAAGNIVIVEMMNHLVRRVDAKTGVITTIAGTGQAGFSGDGGPATEAQFRQPHSIAVDAKGAIYVADIGNHRIRRIDPQSGVVETIAGTGERRLPTEGQVARGNPMLGPRALFIEAGVMWIALREGHSVWRMELNDGVLHHVAGTGKAGYAGNGAAAESAAFNGPKGIAVDARGDIYIADTENNVIRVIDATTWQITTLAGSGPEAAGAAGDGGPATAAQLNRPHGVCVGPDGAVYIGDTLSHRVRRVR